MGAEDTGVPYEHLSLCDEWIKIPLMGKIESLNVSVAAGILIYEAVKQRGFQKTKRHPLYKYRIIVNKQLTIS